MRSLSSFDAIAIFNSPEHNDSPSLTVVTPCIEISKLMDRVMRGLTPCPPIGHDDFEMTTDEEYRNAPMEDSSYVELSDDGLLDLAAVQSNVEKMKVVLNHKSREPEAAVAKQREGLNPSQKQDADKGQEQAE